MRDHESSLKLSRAAAVILGAFMLLGIIIPVKADVSLSPGTDVIASDFKMAVNGLVGTDIYLSKDDFAAALGVESVGKITVVSLPEMTAGRLQLGSRYVEVGQTISERNLDDLKFVPFGSGELAATFGFCRGSDSDGTVYTCTVYVTKKVNTAPYFNSGIASASAVEPTVYSGVTHLGTLSASDSENDEITYKIVSKPSNGTVRLTDKKRGYYEYTSNKDFEGRDSFSVIATDKYGNRSAETAVKLNVSSADGIAVFKDMEGHYAHEAVISCVRSGVIEASIGQSFRPNEDISRAEFLSFAMKSAGYNGFTATNTGFSDDSDILSEHKGYVAVAQAFGIVNGIETESGVCFYPNNRITRLEAAVILSRITGIGGSGAVSVFSDSDAIPAWAQSSVAGLHGAGILRGDGSGNINLYSPVTRGAAAQMIYSSMAYLK